MESFEKKKKEKKRKDGHCHPHWNSIENNGGREENLLESGDELHQLNRGQCRAMNTDPK